jgi:cytoskeletal protein CcmA (bactofilin family)
MVFRKESRAESFQRQISDLRQQLSADQNEDEIPFDDAEPMPDTMAETIYSPMPVASERQMTATPPVLEAATGIVSVGSVWDGTLRADGSIQIFGRVQGDVSATDEIYVAEGAVVDARVSARTVIIAGTVSGTVECTGRLEVLPTGHVSGDVTSPTLVVHEGATVEGDLKMRSPESATAGV